MNLQAIDIWAGRSAALLYLLVLVHQVRWMNYLQAPMFATYVALLFVQRVWNPTTIQASLLPEVWLLVLRFCCVLEAVSLCVGDRRIRERRMVIGLIGAIAAAGMLALHGYLAGPTLRQMYVAVRQHVHVGLALACLFAAFSYAIEGIRVEPTRRRHFLILTFHLCLIAACGFVSPGKGERVAWLETHIAYLSAMAVCCLLWLRSKPIALQFH